MPTIAHASIPPPKSWDEFEDIVLSAAKLRWSSTDFYRHGRSGQSQRGVDIYGHDAERRQVGVQCKNTLEGVAPKIVVEEIARADSFAPPLDALYIATSAKRDAHVQKVVRDISDSRGQNGEFSVGILFWDDIIQELARDQSELFKHYPQFRSGPTKTPEVADLFLTSFALQADGFVPILFPRSDKPEVGARLQKFGSLVNSYRAGRPPTGLLDPSREALAPAQYLVARELSEIQRGGWSVRNIGGIATGTIRPDNPLTTTTSLSPEQLATLFRDNPFWALPMESMYWSFPRFKLPPGSNVELYHIPTSPETGPEKRGVRIRKEPFFLYQVELEPVSAINGLPNGVDLPEQPKSPLLVVFIKVRVAATFLPMTSDNQAEELKHWAVWLTGQLKESFADDR